MTHSPRVTPLLLFGALALSACSQDAAAPVAQDGADVPTSESPSAEAAPALADYVINTPIAAEDIDTRLELVGAPVHLAGSDTMHVTVRVHNDGRAILASEGSAPVHLGVMLLGPEGPDKAPGNREFQRLAIPAVPAGASVEVTGELPVQPLLGLGVRFELVQEGVNWFSAYGEAPLDLGTFARCDEAAATLCGADGQPLASE